MSCFPVARYRHHVARRVSHRGPWRHVGARDQPAVTATTSVVDGESGVLIGTYNGVFRSTDEGLSWTHRGLTGRPIRHMITRPGGEIYAAVDNGSDSSARMTMIRSVDNGVTWTAADEGLSGHSIYGLALDDSGTLYAAGVTGVYRSEPAGRWKNIGLHTVLGRRCLAPLGATYLR